MHITKSLIGFPHVLSGYGMFCKIRKFLFSLEICVKLFIQFHLLDLLIEIAQFMSMLIIILFVHISFGIHFLKILQTFIGVKDTLTLCSAQDQMTNQTLFCKCFGFVQSQVFGSVTLEVLYVMRLLNCCISYTALYVTRISLKSIVLWSRITIGGQLETSAPKSS